jgi:ABC-2 type transport system ATP-binding protein
VHAENVIEVQFVKTPPDWEQSLQALPKVNSVQSEGAGMYRILASGADSVTALVECALSADVKIKSLSVQSTTLDDVFVHYTGRQLRDEQVKSHMFVMPDRPGDRA